MFAKEVEWAKLSKDTITEPANMQFIKPSKDMTWHLKSSYIKALINGRLIYWVFIDKRDILNVMAFVNLMKLGNSKSDLISTNMKVTNFFVNVMVSIGVLVTDITMGPKTLSLVFFVVDAKPTYFMLLGIDWIHSIS